VFKGRRASGSCLGLLPLASGPPFWGAPLRCYAHKFFLFLVKNALFIHIMGYKAGHKQALCFQRGPTSETAMCRYFAFKRAPNATEMCKYSAFKLH